MKKFAIAVLALAVSAGIGYAAGVNAVPGLSSLNPKAFKYVLPDNIKWGPAAGLEGTDAYTLVGDPAKPASMSSSTASIPAISVIRTITPTTVTSW